MNESFVFYKSYHEAIQCLPEEMQLEAYKSICEYAITGQEPEVSNPIVKAIFKMAKPTVNSNLARKENGKLGGAPKGNQNARKQPKVDDEKQQENNQNNHRLNSNQPNENENEDENVNETSPLIPPDGDKSVDNFPKQPPEQPKQPDEGGRMEGRQEEKILIGKDYHVAWDNHFAEELRPLSQGQIGEIDFWLKKYFLDEEIPAHIIRNALITKAKRENKQEPNA